MTTPPTQFAWTPKQKFQRGIWAVSIFLIVSVGTITGAILKEDKQKEEVQTQTPSLGPLPTRRC